MLLMAISANTRLCKNTHEKNTETLAYGYSSETGTVYQYDCSCLRVLGESYPMNTSTTCVDVFHNSLHSCVLEESRRIIVRLKYSFLVLLDLIC